jgi:hypothetical protein
VWCDDDEMGHRGFEPSVPMVLSFGFIIYQVFFAAKPQKRPENSDNKINMLGCSWCENNKE